MKKTLLILFLAVYGLGWQKWPGGSVGSVDTIIEKDCKVKNRHEISLFKPVYIEAEKELRHCLKKFKHNKGKKKECWKEFYKNRCKLKKHGKEHHHGKHHKKEKKHHEKDD